MKPLLRPAIAALLLAFTIFWLFFTSWRLGIADEWVLTPNARAWPIGAWGIPVAVIVIFGGAAALSVYDRFKRAKSRKEQTNSTVTALVCMAVVLWVWPWALLGPGQIGSNDRSGSFKLTLEGRYNVIASLWSDVATEYFGAAWQMNDAGAFIRDYAQKSQKVEARAQAHIATHPPGAVLFYYGARRIYESSPFLSNQMTTLASAITGQSEEEMASNSNLLRETSSRSAKAPFNGPLPASAVGGALWTAMVLGLSLVLAIPAVYGTAIYGVPEAEREKRGLLAVAFFTLAPATNLFAFSLDALIAAGVAWTLFFASRSFPLDANGAKAKKIWPLMAGFTLGITSFVSLGALAVIFLILVAFFLYTLSKDKRGALTPCLLFGSGFLVFWLSIVVLFPGFNPVEVVKNALSAHHFATVEVRSRIPWIPMNLVMWALFMGWGIVVALPKAKSFFKQGINENLGICIGVASIFTILLLTSSGNVRGEVERLWLFLLMPAAILAASRISFRVAVPLLGLQILQTLIMAAMLAPLVRPF
jgi:hypothetical protein